MASAANGRQLVRFMAAGAAAVSTDFGVYYLLRGFVPPSAAKAASFVCGTVVAYLLNNYWVFEQGRASSGVAVRFVVANALIMGANVLTHGTVLKVSPGAVAPALVTATVVTSALSYVSFKWWVFPRT